MSRLIRRPLLAAFTLCLAIAIAAVPLNTVLALITGGEGNTPVNDPGWPKGAAAIFNHTGRVAYWVGPPFGGGQWHAECRGDAAAFNAVLADFAKIEAKTKRLVIHDGVGQSTWLNASRNKDKNASAKLDWLFMVWEPKSWENLRNMPAEFSPVKGSETSPTTQIDVYAGGAIHWSDVTVPEGIEVDDQRMEAHGFTPADGVVMEGKVIDLATKAPLAARMQLQLIETPKTGGYKYTNFSDVTADAQGHWVVKKVPPGWYRVVIDMAGYAPRIAGHAQFDEQPRWNTYDTGLSRTAAAAGRVLDEAGKPIADAEVRFDGLVVDGGRYESPNDEPIKTDADGNFRADTLPIANASIWIHKPGYVRPGLGLKIKTPKTDIALEMKKSSKLVVSVDFGKIKPPASYMVNLAPEGAGGVGTWGGSGNIDDKKQMIFKDVPPGRYVVDGNPNPYGPNQKSKPKTVELKGGEVTELLLPADLPPEPPPAVESKPVRPPKPTTDDAF